MGFERVIGGRSRSSQAVAGDDLALLGAIRNGDRRAFEALYRGYHPRLARFVGTIVSRPALIEEVVNDTMMTVWTKPDAFAGLSKVSTWVFGIAYRKALKARARDDVPVEDDGAETRPSTAPRPDEDLADGRLRALLARAIDGLSADHRAVVDLTYFHELGYREIAEIVGCPVDTVKTRMFHARRQLRRALPGELADWL